MPKKSAIIADAERRATGVNPDGTLDVAYWTSGRFIAGPALVNYVKKETGDDIAPNQEVRVYRPRPGDKALQVSLKVKTASAGTATLSYVLPFGKGTTDMYAETWLLKQ